MFGLFFGLTLSITGRRVRAKGGSFDRGVGHLSGGVACLLWGWRILLVGVGITGAGREKVCGRENRLFECENLFRWLEILFTGREYY